MTVLKKIDIHTLKNASLFAYLFDYLFAYLAVSSFISLFQACLP